MIPYQTERSLYNAHKYTYICGIATFTAPRINVKQIAITMVVKNLTFSEMLRLNGRISINTRTKNGRPATHSLTMNFKAPIYVFNSASITDA